MAEDKLPDIALIDIKIAEAEAEMAKAETTAEKRKAKERKEDLLRLKRVEQIYVRSVAYCVRFVTNSAHFVEFRSACPFRLGAGTAQIAAGNGQCRSWQCPTISYIGKLSSRRRVA